MTMTVTKLRPSFALDEDRIHALRQVVPEAFADGRINWETLREVLGEQREEEDPGDEHFGMFWPGKREARRLASKPSKSTLVPVPGEGHPEEEASRRNQLIHTFGNLTLLTEKLNHEVSNGPWLDKRTKILENTALNLNLKLSNYEPWTESSIVERGEKLFEVARGIWPYPVAE